MLRLLLQRSHPLWKRVQKRATCQRMRAVSQLASRRKASEMSNLLTYAQRTTPLFCRVQPYAANLPAHTKVVLPALSPTMEEGTLITWAKKEGDKLNEGDLLAEIETDKATMAFETPEEGFLAKILVPAGTKGIPIGRLVCIIVANEADIAAFKDFKDEFPATQKGQKAAAAAVESGKAAGKDAGEVERASEVAKADGGRVYASPMAKRLAEQQKIRLEGKGSGLYGSITSADLGKIATSEPAKPVAEPRKVRKAAGEARGAFVDIPLTTMRATIAKRLTQSASTIPHFYLSIEVNLDVINNLRTRINKESKNVKLSVNDFVVKAVAMANMRVPEANSQWMESSIRQFDNVDVSIAVATDTGLITPIVFEANRKGIMEISREVKDLAGRARAGKLQPQEFQGGTITVSNLGMFDVKCFTAIINPPQSVIIAVGTGKKRLFEDLDAPKGIRTSTTMIVTMSCDHRVVDGAVAARWAESFRQFVEDPLRMLL